MLKIPYGLADYRELRTDNCFYMDRTDYIEQLETFASRYVMFLRPRRFGKSLFVSMLEHYYDVNQAAHFQRLFGDLHVGRHPTPLANQFLILQFDFSGIETNAVKEVYASFLKKIKSGIYDFMTHYASFFNAAERNRIEIQSSPASSIIEFFDIFRAKQLPNAIYVLIDEYDQFTNELLSFHFADFQEIVSRNGYVRKFYEVLKTEARRGSIARIFMTGVAPVTVDSMTSGFNITTNLSLRTRFHQMMGFTEREVAHFIEQLGIPLHAQESTLTTLRAWYDGYRFHPNGLEHLYNPDMVLYFGDYYQSENTFPPEMLAANVATDYQKIAQIFKIGGNEDTALAHLNQLLETGEVSSYLTDKFNVAMGFGIKDIWSMLFYTGMTTVKSVFGNDWTFQMPNYVIQKLYFDYFTALSLGMDYNNLTHLIRDSIRKLVNQGQISDFVGLVSRALAKAHSNRDKITYGEKHLKTLMLGLLFPYESYMIRSEPEIEGKYPDIFLERIPQVPIKYEIVLELKYIKKEDKNKWLDKDGNLVSPPTATAAQKKVAKPRKTQVTPPAAPATPANPPVISLLDDVSEKGANQLAGYMESDYLQRPNVLGFCLVFVSHECVKIVPYSKKG
jgi:Predicted AAA-ATPase